MHSAEDLISVIIPTCNRWEVLRQVLCSLDEQESEGWPFEVIVADDGSADDTPALLARSSFSYPFDYLRQDRRGPAAARNAALRKAAGRIVLFLNDDCLAAPDLLARHRRMHRRFGPSTVLGRIAWSPEIELQPEVRALIDRYYFPYEQISDHENVSFAFFITGNLSLPRSWLLKAGGFDEDFHEASCEDIELGYRLYKSGLPMRYDPEALAYHLHQLDFDDLFERQKKFAYWLAVFLKKHPQAKAYYAGLPTENEHFNVPKSECLQLLLKYAAYRGFKEALRARAKEPSS
ncbi:MAG: glycosyltransferase [Dethiobacteria bacterium]